MKLTSFWIRFLSAASVLILLAVTLDPCAAATSAKRFGSSLPAFHVDRLLTTQTPAENRPTVTLKAGEPVESQIKGGETQTATLALQKDQYARVVFEWRGIDLNVEVRGPADSQANTTTQITGSRALPISIVADADGEWTLTIRPLEDAKINGGFRITLSVLRPANADDRKLVEAAALIVEAQKEKSKEVAIQELLKAEQLFTEAGEQSGSAYSLQLLGRLLIPGTPCFSADNSTLQKGDEYYQRAIELLRRGDRQQLAYSLLEIGSDYEKFVCPPKARAYYTEALNIFRELDKRGEARALYTIGLSEANTRSVHEAIKWYTQALAIQRAQNDGLNEAKTLNALAGAYDILGDKETALNYYLQAQLFFHEIGDTYLEALLIKNIGLIFDDLGDWQRAKDDYIKSRGMLESLLSTKDLDSCKSQINKRDITLCNSIANAFDNIGELYNSLGDPDSALEVLQECLLIRQSVNQPKGIGATLSRIAYAYLLKNDPSEALRYCDLALSKSQQANDFRKLGSIATFRGMAYTALNQPEKALPHLTEGLEFQRQAGDRRGEGIALDQMGRAYALQKNAEQTFASYNAALAIWKEVKDEEWETRTLYNISNAERERGNLVQAEKQIDNAIAIIESRRAKLRSMQLRTAYFANKEDLFKLKIDLQMQLGQTRDPSNYAAALQTSEETRARILMDTLSQLDFRRGLNSQLLKSNSELVELINRKRQVQEKLDAKLKLQIKRDQGQSREIRAKLARDIDLLTDERDQLEALITNRRVNVPPLTLSQLQKQLDDQTVVLEYSLGDPRSYVWVVTTKSIEGVALPARDAIEKAGQRMSDALTARNREPASNAQARSTFELEHEYAEASKELSQIILAPVEPLTGGKRLAIVADGILQIIPFAALPVTTETPSPALITRHEIVMLSSASVLALQRSELANRTPAHLSVAVLADPVFDAKDSRVSLVAANANKNRSDVAPVQENSEASHQSKRQLSQRREPVAQRPSLSRALRDIGMGVDDMPRLALSRDEAHAIEVAARGNKAFSALDFKASREMAMSPELSRYRIIHFATHGVLDLEHPELSGIVLSLVDEKGEAKDGYLRLNDIYNLNLPAELVVLSACQTGVGRQIKGEGLIALTRGFMYAGAKSVVASLWKVDDAATAALMTEFYKQMFANKLKPAAALRAAQLSISQQKRWQSPYYWAGFFLQGDWN